MKAIQLFLVFLCLLCVSTHAFGAANTANILVLNTATTNVTTGAYVTIGSVPASFSPSKLVVVNKTSSIIKIAYGPAGSETDFVAVEPAWMDVIPLERHLAAGTRISVEAVDATASTAYIAVSLVP